MIAVENLLTFSARAFVLGVDPESGGWKELTFAGEPILRGGNADFAVNLEGWTTIETRLVSSRQTAGADCDRVVLVYELSAEDGRRCAAEQQINFFDDRIERTLFLQHEASRSRERLHSATFLADGLTAGDPAQTEVSMPMTRSLPALALEEVAARAGDWKKDERGFAFDPTGLDVGLATALISRREPPLHISILPLPDECPVQARLHGRDGRLVLAQEFACEAWLENGARKRVAKQTFLCTRESWPEAVRATGNYWPKQNYSPPADRAAWARNAIILEVDLEFTGGLQKLTAQLDEIQAIGFDTVYLMPWHPGHWNGYGTQRYDEVNPAYGSFHDLRALCDGAHQRGMHVLFDLLVNVAGKDSSYPSEHPDWFYRDAKGEILLHPIWRSWCFDPAAPGFRKFLTDYAVRCCAEWGADGFRVDAAAYRGGNWNNLPGIQPHQHSHAIFTLLDEVRAAIRAVKPAAVCMSECFGPAQVPISDLVAYQWVAWLDWINESLLSGRVRGAALARLLAEHFLAMPRDTWLTGYTHTHDTIAFEKRDLDGPAIAAFLATLNFVCAGTMVFGGGWQMRARPDAAESDEYQQMFAMKKKLGGIASHEVRFMEQHDPSLFMVERPSQLGRVRVLSNFGSEPVSIAAGEPIYSRLGSCSGQLAPFDTVVIKA